ncbi:hypothetical protein ACIBQ1_12690 [Nonomuraea sp. NPDC050153]|uniref:hypothetical protein n=1 Tax=Nonomuraea sp. NPDC050153 TaxID=3364359 RepID=UPI0037B3A7B6
MADHDRDAGSRGEEEAPRDPTPADELHEPEERSRLRYGEAPPGPGFTMPLAPPPRPGSYREFFRQKQAQVLGAGLIGLVLGAVLGGTAVAMAGDFSHRDEMHRGVYWEELGWAPKRFQVPDRLGPACERGPDGVQCGYVLPEPRSGDVAPAPSAPIPLPTSSG